MGVDDPYSKITRKDISEALKLEPVIKEFIDKGDNKVEKILKVSANGNIMDSALYSNLHIGACVLDEMERPFFIYDGKIFLKDLRNAKTILIRQGNLKLCQFQIEEYTFY